MDTLSYKTKSVNKANANKQWLVVDVEGQALGRAASKIAKILRGKHKPEFTPHDDCGDYVIVLNADKISLSGKKWEQKEYIWYTGYPGGQRSLTADKLKERDGLRLLEKSVRGMLPKTKLGRQIFKNMYLYEGTEHDKQAQKPSQLNINEFK